MMITDAAINIVPSLDDKVDIVKNSIDLAHTIGVERPNVAILSAIETVTSKMVSTIDAAALCKMADRGQIQARCSTALGVRYRGQRGGRQHQEPSLPCRGRGGYPHRPGPRGRQHARQRA